MSNQQKEKEKETTLTINFDENTCTFSSAEPITVEETHPDGNVAVDRGVGVLNVGSGSSSRGSAGHYSVKVGQGVGVVNAGTGRASSEGAAGGTGSNIRIGQGIGVIRGGSVNLTFN